MSSRTSALPVGVLVAVVLAGHLTLWPKVAELDSFYHLGHAAAYAEGSIFDTSFPWATQSAVADYGADLWWGFHVVLLPFTAFGDVTDSVRAAAVALSLVLAFTALWVLRRHGVSGAAWWATLFLIAVPNVFYRYLMARPHVLSLAAALALASLLARGRWWQVALVSGLLTWLHVSLFWMAPGVLAAHALARLVRRLTLPAPSVPYLGVPLPAAGAAVLLGTLAGWLLRPRPLETAMLANVQIIRLFAEKATEAPLLFATELAPLPPLDLLRSSWLLLAAWLGAAALAVSLALRGRLADMREEERSLLATSILVSGAFLGLALLVARRGLVEWAAFAFLTIPLVWPHGRSGGRAKIVGVIAGVLLAVHVPWAAYRHRLNVEYVAFPGNALAGAAEWLEANSRPGDVVFHAHWDNFAPLFARNRTNRYLGGMDPIFQLAHDPRLYWEHFWLSSDIHDEWTCDAFPCPAGVATDTHTVVRTHFGARWILTEPRRNPRLTLFLLKDPGFALALETPREAVFEVLEPDAIGAGDAGPGSDVAQPRPRG